MPEKTAISRYHQWFQREMTSDGQAQKFHTIYPDLDSPSDWWKQISHAAQLIRSTNQIWEAKRHQYGIFTLLWFLRRRRHFAGKPVAAQAEMSAVFTGYKFIGTQKSQVRLPQDRFGTLKSPSFDCFDIQYGKRNVM